MYFFSVATFFKGMLFSGVNISEGSSIRILSPILRFKVQSRVPGPPRDPNKKVSKWYKFDKQNDCILSFTCRKGADDASKYQV